MSEASVFNKHLPLKVSPLTPSTIETAAGGRISIGWSVQQQGDIDTNPYAEAEEFAAALVNVANRDHLFDEMATVLEPLAAEASSKERDGDRDSVRVTIRLGDLRAVRAILSRVQAATSHADKPGSAT